jgi:hypothetical protein
MTTVTHGQAAGVITYEGMHGLGRRDQRAVRDQLAACMARFGHGAEPSVASVLLDLAGDDDPALLAAREELAAEYGPYPQKITGSGPDGHEWRAFLWRLSTMDPAAIDAALDRTAALRARGGLLERRVGMKLEWAFRLRDPDTRELLPGQDTLPRLDRFPGGRGDSSSAVLTLRATPTLSLWLLFPFAEPSVELRAYVERLQSALPMPLAAKGWRQWRLTRSGTWKGARVAV